MNVNQMIELLQEIQENGHGEKEIRLAVQPGYPIVETLQGISGPDQFLDAVEDLDDEEADASKADRFVWLVSGGQPSSYEESPYAPAWVFSNYLDA